MIGISKVEQDQEKQNIIKLALLIQEINSETYQKIDTEKSVNNEKDDQKDLEKNIKERADTFAIRLNEERNKHLGTVEILCK